LAHNSYRYSAAAATAASC